MTDCSQDKVEHWSCGAQQGHESGSKFSFTLATLYNVLPFISSRTFTLRITSRIINFICPFWVLIVSLLYPALCSSSDTGGVLIHKKWLRRRQSVTTTRTTIENLRRQQSVTRRSSIENMSRTLIWTLENRFGKCPFSLYSWMSKLWLCLCFFSA